MKIFLLFIMFFIVGCESIPKVQEVEKQIYVEVPSEYLAECNITPPINKDQYLSTPITEREGVMYNYSRSLLLDLGNCNIQIRNLKTWNIKQAELFKPK